VKSKYLANTQIDKVNTAQRGLLVEVELSLEVSISCRREKDFSFMEHDPTVSDSSVSLRNTLRVLDFIYPQSHKWWKKVLLVLNTYKSIIKTKHIRFGLAKMCIIFICHISKLTKVNSAKFPKHNTRKY